MSKVKIYPGRAVSGIALMAAAWRYTVKDHNILGLLCMTLGLLSWQISNSQWLNFGVGVKRSSIMLSKNPDYQRDLVQYQSLGPQRYSPNIWKNQRHSCTPDGSECSESGVRRYCMPRDLPERYTCIWNYRSAGRGYRQVPGKSC